ncbi:MAG: NfeD family protein [Lachnospiraceae bacterium]|nr:NfeD family protein [Lachnospiraceae bacterium]MCR5478037.1 NfeD family protein [Lachnospiraceae bacterium]
MSAQVIFWLAVLIVMIVAEIITMGLTTIWFAGGALVAALLACVLPNPFWLQLVVFAVVSLVLLALTRPLAMKHFNKERLLTNAESLVGQRCVVTSEIDNLRGIGQVTVKGQEWTARTEEDGRVIPAGTIVKILAINGVKLIVAIDESMEDAVPVIRSEANLDPRVIEEQEEEGDSLGSMKF